MILPLSVSLGQFHSVCGLQKSAEIKFGIFLHITCYTLEPHVTLTYLIWKCVNYFGCDSAVHQWSIYLLTLTFSNDNQGDWQENKTKKIWQKR